MQEKSTYELDKMLEQMKVSQLERYYKDNQDYLADDERPFYHFYKSKLKEHHIRLKDIYIAVDVSESYGEKVIQETKHTTNRDLILRFCIAGHLSLIDINRALKLYQMKPLYSKDKRDACIILAVNNRKYDLDEIDELLWKQGFKKLMKDEESHEK